MFKIPKIKAAVSGSVVIDGWTLAIFVLIAHNRNTCFFFWQINEQKKININYTPFINMCV